MGILHVTRGKCAAGSKGRQNGWRGYRLAAALVAAAMLCGAKASSAGEAPTIRAGSELDFRPYCFTTLEGQPTGFGVDLLTAVADKVGLRLRVSAGPWDKLWDELVAGQLDVLPIVARTAGREPLVDFCLPHTETFDAFFVRAGRPPLKDLAAAAGKEIVVLRSDAAHHELLERKFAGKVVPVASISEGLRLVATGRHDALLCSRLIGELERQQAGVKGVEGGPLIPDYKRTFSFAVRKGNAELVEKLNEGLAIVRADGTYDRLYRKWLGQETTPRPKWQEYFWPGVASIAVLALLVAAWRISREAAKWDERLFRLMAPGRVAVLPAVWRYGLVVVVVAVATAMRMALLPLLGPMVPYSVALVATVAATIVLGVGPGLLTLVSVDLAVEVFVLGSGPVLLQVPALARLGISISTGVFIVLVLHAARVAAVRARESEGLLGNVLSGAEVAIAMSEVLERGKDFRFVSVNRACIEWSGLRLEEWIGRRPADMHTPEIAANICAHYRQAVETGRSLQYEECLPLRSGELWTLTTVSPVRDAQGEISRVVASSINITEWKRAEEALNASRNQLQAIINNTPALVYAFDLEERFVMANSTLAELLGSTPEQMLGKRRGEFMPKQDAEWHEANDRQAIEAGRALEFEEYSELKGQSITWLTTKFPLRDAQGRICAVAGISADISERKRTEEELRKSKERQGYLLRLGDALRPLKDPVDVQEGAARVLGEHLGAERALYFEVCGPDYVIERDYTKGVAPLRGTFSIAAFGQKLCEAYQAGRTVVVKDVQTDASLSPEERPAYAAIEIGAHVGVPLVKGGRLVGGLAVHAKERREWTVEEVRLIEETAERTWANVVRARAEEALRESEERFRTMADGTPVIIWVHDAGGGLQFVNRAYREFFGASIEGVCGGGWQPSVYPEDEPGYVEEFVKCNAERRRFQAQARVRRHDGEWRWIESYGAPRFSGSGEYLGMAGSSVDITERKTAEAVLARDKEELERLVAQRTAKLRELVGELEHFSYTITHDMRAPLRGMQGFAEMMVEACGGCAQQDARGFLKRIQTSATRMDRLITDALNYNRAVRQDLPLEPVDIEALLRGMVDSYPELQPARANVVLEGRIPLVMGNEAGLTQVFSNLLGNAVKFVKPGDKPQVRVWGEAVGGPRPAGRSAIAGVSGGSGNNGEAATGDGGGDGWVRVWVEDEGIGIAESMKKRVFDLFARGGNSYEGTGIGLALVRKVVHQMCGRVGVESEEGKGSRFWVELRPGEVRVERDM